MEQHSLEFSIVIGGATGKVVFIKLSEASTFTQISKEHMDCLRFVMCPPLVPHFFAAATNGTNEINKAGTTCH